MGLRAEALPSKCVSHCQWSHCSEGLSLWEITFPTTVETSETNGEETRWHESVIMQ